MPITAYRSEEEYPILLLTLVIIGGLFLISAGFTVCLAPLLLILAVAAAYQSNRSGHAALLRQAYRVPLDGGESLPFSRVAEAARECLRRLRPGSIDLFIARGREVNAYTFGLGDPKVVVLFAPLVELMDEDELKFVIGHELGHVALGHTWLNTLVGGLAGVPQTFGTAMILTGLFRWWNRACEYSADRAGLLACQNPDKAVSALVKLVAGSVDTPAELRRAMVQIDAQDDTWQGGLSELLATHPMIIKRIREIQKFAASSAYRRLSAQMG
jgi:Zn-dependent protease with chaperone function